MDSEGLCPTCQMLEKWQDLYSGIPNCYMSLNFQKPKNCSLSESQADLPLKYSWVFKNFPLETLKSPSIKKWLSSWNLYTTVAQLHELFLLQSFSCLQPLHAGFTGACWCTCLWLLCMVRNFPSELSLYSFNHNVNFLCCCSDLQS